MEPKSENILTSLFEHFKQNILKSEVPMKFCHKGFLFTDDSEKFEINPSTSWELEVDITFHWVDQIGKKGTVKDFNSRNEADLKNWLAEKEAEESSRQWIICGNSA